MDKNFDSLTTVDFKMQNGNSHRGADKRSGQGPEGSLRRIAEDAGLHPTDLAFALLMDKNDPLRDVRSKFVYPKNKTLPGVDLTLVNADDDAIYLCGNSLGLMPRTARDYVTRELDRWSEVGVFGHFTGDLPWTKCDDFAAEASARLVGAHPDEVAIMSSLTVNLSLLLSAMYCPTGKRYKIMMESKAFPSDHYVVSSQIKSHGYNPDTAIIQVSPREGQVVLQTDDIAECIEKHGDEIAVILFSGIQYYTGQLFDMKRITNAGHAKGCVVGFDLAHAVGNVELKLHDWDVDFAAWCNYKYVNSSPGGIGGLFFHRKWHDDRRKELQLDPVSRIEGWWGHTFEKRFSMDNERDLMPGAGGFKLSNTPALLVAPLLASLQIFDSVDFQALLDKQFLLTGYLEFLLRTISKQAEAENRPQSVLEILTPSDPSQRGCQLSIAFQRSVAEVHAALKKQGVVCDERKPRVLRVSPTPLYNSFTDVFRFCQALKLILAKFESNGV